MYLNLRIVSKIFAAVFLIALTIFNLSCGGNVLGAFANQESDEALYFSALNSLNDEDYAGAITTCTEMSDAYLTERKPAALCAAAYAGRCGFTMTSMLTDLAAKPGATPYLKYFIGLLTYSSGADGTSRMADCKLAQSMVRNIGAAEDRTNDENAFLVMLSIYQMGVYANALLDKSADNGTAAGGADGDACNVADMTNAQSDDVALAFWDLDKSLDELSAIAPFTSIDTVIDAACTLLEGQFTSTICTTTTPTTGTGANRLSIQSAFKEGSAFGVDQGACGGLDVTNAGCRCP